LCPRFQRRTRRARRDENGSDALAPIHASDERVFKKLENLKAAVSVFMAWYNFCHVRQTLRVTPAMKAGIADHVWSIEEIVRLA